MLVLNFFIILVNMMVEYYDGNFVSLHVRVSNRPALQMYRDNLGFEVLGIEKAYYADKEDAFKMKKYFKESDKEKDKDKFIEISNDIKWEDIKDTFEEIDVNGEEKNEDVQQNVNEEKKIDEETKIKNEKKKKKKGKK